MTVPSEVAPRQVGRRRSVAADTAILEATVELLREVGYDRLTVSAVIDRAGVSSATLYRRWTTKPDLVVAAVSGLVPAVADVDQGSLADDLEVFVAGVARSISTRDETVADALTAAARRDPNLAEALEARFVRPRAAALDAILTRAVARGELLERPSVEVATSLVLGPVYHRGLYLRLSLTPAFVHAATAHVLRGLGASGPGPAPRRRSRGSA